MYRGLFLGVQMVNNGVQHCINLSKDIKSKMLKKLGFKPFLEQQQTTHNIKYNIGKDEVVGSSPIISSRLKTAL